MAPSNDESPIYFILHIPKTATTSIQIHMIRYCAPGVFLGPQVDFRLGDLTGKPYRPNTPSEIRRARVISGHAINKSLEKYFFRREIRRIVLLRDPLELQVSLYNYRMIDNLSKGLGTYSFLLHLRALRRNFISDFFLTRWLEIPRSKLRKLSDTEKYTIVNQELKNFWFVGAHTNCDQIISVLAAELYIPSDAQRRNQTGLGWQERVPWTILTLEALSPTTRTKFLANNTLDQALWETWRDAGFNTGVAHLREIGPQYGSIFHDISRPFYEHVRHFQRNWLPCIREWGTENAAIRSGLKSIHDAYQKKDWNLLAAAFKKTLESISDEAPIKAEIWVNYGHCLKNIGRLLEAEEAYRSSLALYPYTGDTFFHLGYVLLLQRKEEEARQYFLVSLKLDPSRYAHEKLLLLEHQQIVKDL